MVVNRVARKWPGAKRIGPREMGTSAATLRSAEQKLGVIESKSTKQGGDLANVGADALSPVVVHSGASAGPAPAWSVSWVDGTGVDVTVNFVPTQDLGARRRWAWNLLADVLASHACGEVSDASSDDDSDPEPDDGTSAAVREPVAIPPAGFDGGAALPLPDPVTPAESALAAA